MSFFAEQDRARQATVRRVALYAAAIAIPVYQLRSGTLEIAALDTRLPRQ